MPVPLTPAASSTPEQLQTAEQFMAFMEHGPSVAWMLDTEMRIKFLSGQFESELGLSRASIIGKTVFELFPQAVAQRLSARARAVLESGQASEHIEHLPAKANDRGTWLVCRFPVDDGGRRILGCVAFNITDRFLAQSALREAEERVAHDRRERERLEEQLRAAERMASMGTLAAGVAHEINNPLSYVIANLDMLDEDLRSGQRQHSAAELVRQARSGAERVREIVRGLKTFSRADEERRTRIQLHAVLDQAIDMTSNELRHRARIVKDYGELPEVMAEETRLAQVFVNLLVNAMQATPEGDAHAHEVRLRTRTDARGHASIEVHDTGAGIAPAVLPHIFDPFFTTKPVGVGTGLGLSICHGIITALEGEISVRSEPGKGSVFTIVLPPAPALALPAAAAPAASTRATEQAPEQRTALATPRSARVLIIDDDPMVASSLGRALRREHVVTSADSARAALELIERGEDYDVIFCDLMMPEMSGMELYAHLQRHAAALCERVIFMTGGAFSSDASEFLADLRSEWVEKPFDIGRVRALVRQRVAHAPEL